MKKTFFLRNPWTIILFFLLCSTLSFAAETRNPKFSLVRIVDPITQKDTAIISNLIVVRNLYTDSLKIGIESYDTLNVFTWFPLEFVDYFRIDNSTFAGKIIKSADGTEKRVFMQLDKNRHSNTRIYISGIKKNRQYYTESPDGIMCPIDDLKKYRLEERVERTGNTNFYRRFRWGVSAGIIGSTPKMDSGYGTFSTNPFISGDIWSDIPLDPFGFSLHTRARLCCTSGKMKSYTKNDELEYEIAINASSISIPISIRYSLIPLKGNFIPYIEAGIDLRYVYSNTLHGVTRVNTYYNTWETDNKKDFKTLFTLGAGLEWKFSENHSVWLNFDYIPKTKFESFDISKKSMIYNLNLSNWAVSLSYNL